MAARGQITLFHIKGIRVGVDWSWFLILFLVIYWLSGFYESILGDPGGAGPYALAVASALLFFTSILLHELGHAVVSIRNGVAISEITLWLFGGVAKRDRDSNSAGEEFRVAAAGPLVTLLIAVGLTGLGIAVAGNEAFADAALVREEADISGVLAMVAWLASINSLILIFNLIPAYPLDGGRIARAIAWKVTGDRNRATGFAARVGQGFSYLFITLGFVLIFQGDPFGGIWLAFIGFMLGQSARATVLQTEVSKRISGIRVADVMDAEPVAIPEGTSVEAALDEYFLRYQWPWFPVVDAAQRFTGLVQRGAADAVPETSRASSTIAEVADLDTALALQVRDDEPLESLIGNKYLGTLGALAAVDATGHLRGVITSDAFARALRDAFQTQPEGL